jgi:hypothetical protein
MKMKIYTMMDEPGRFGPLKDWEGYLERVKRLPLDALERESALRVALEVIEDLKQHAEISRTNSD